MISTRALTKRYGAVMAVQSVDLDVREGDRYGLLGPNGSGKTTLVRMLLGLVYATSGEIDVLGQRIPQHTREVLPQIGALIEEPAAPRDIQRGFGIQVVYVVLFLAAAWANFSTKDITA